jgi:ABC-type nitrate/sulfonate/bicarbonate transport system permease component
VESSDLARRPVAGSTSPHRPAPVRWRRWAATGARAALGPLLALAIVVGAWELAVAVFEPEPYLVPSPHRVASAFGELRDVLPTHVGATAVEALIGLVTGAAAGVVIALFLVAFPLLQRLVYPLLVTSQTIPMVVLAPLLVVWFGFGLAPKVIVVALIAFFPVAVGTVSGLASADPEMLGLLRSMGAGRLKLFRFVQLPSALPSFFGGLKVAAAYSVAGAVVGEWVGAESGLGILITRAQASYRVDRVFVAIAVIAALSIALFIAVHVLARLAMPWLYVHDSREGSK